MAEATSKDIEDVQKRQNPGPSRPAPRVEPKPRRPSPLTGYQKKLSEALGREYLEVLKKAELAVAHVKGPAFAKQPVTRARAQDRKGLRSLKVASQNVNTRRFEAALTGFGYAFGPFVQATRGIALALASAKDRAKKEKDTADGKVAAAAAAQARILEALYQPLLTLEEHHLQAYRAIAFHPDRTARVRHVTSLMQVYALGDARQRKLIHATIKVYLSSSLSPAQRRALQRQWSKVQKLAK